jgi:hypothetical protein
MGWNYQQYADWLNDNGYKAPRGKKFGEDTYQYGGTWKSKKK